jgi:hypothetical protein
VPTVRSALTIDVGLSLDAVGERATGLAGRVRAFDDDARVRAVVVDGDEFFARTLLDGVGQRRVFAEQLLGEVDELPELPVAALCECGNDLLGAVLRGVMSDAVIGESPGCWRCWRPADVGSHGPHFAERFRNVINLGIILSNHN